MYYDDEARRFNFLSGFLLGAVLGTGIALLAGPVGGRTRKGRSISSATEAAVSQLVKSSRTPIAQLRKARRKL